MASRYSRDRELDIGHIVLMHRRYGLGFANKVFKRICRVRGLMLWETLSLADKVMAVIDEEAK